MKYAALIMAGGSGKRFGAPGGKQLFEYKGKPIVLYTIRKFLGLVDQLIVVIEKSSIPALEKYLKKYKFKIDVIVAGGPERYDSVKNGLAAVAADIDQVLIHDGVRPNVSRKLINDLKAALVKYPAVIPVVPVVDTVKIIKEKEVVQTPDRSELFSVQTPQGFNKALLNSAYRQVDLSGCTDDAMVLERFGQKVFTVSGERENIKITNPEDLKFLKSLN